jgi:DNA repair protein RecO (recombination protein O)
MPALRSGLALLLKSTDTGDDDKAVTLLNPEHGRFGALARHARASKRRFGPALQPFCLFEAAWRPKPSGLSFLENVHALEFPLGADPGLEALGSAYLFLELALELCPLAEPQPAFFELVLGGLRRLGKGAEAAAAVRLSVLWGALGLAGLAPDLDSSAGWAGLKLDQKDLKALQEAAGGRPILDPRPRAERVLQELLALHLGRPLRTAGLADQLNGDAL